MTDRFEAFVNGFSDEEYEEWIDGRIKANGVYITEAQEEKALNIRTPLSEQEEEDIEAQQVFIEQESGVRTIDVGDNRDLPIIRRPVILETQETQQPRIIEPETQKIIPLIPERPITIPRPIPVQRQQSTLRRAISGLRTRLSNILRRNRKPNA